MKTTLKFFSVISLLITSHVSSATIISLDPTADGYDETSLLLPATTNVVTTGDAINVSQSGHLVTNAILEYDLTGIDTSTITGASLEITLDRFISNTASTTEIDIFAYDGDGIINHADSTASATQVVNTNTPTAGTTGGNVLTFNFDTVAPLTALSGDLLTLRLETDSFASIAFASLDHLNYDAATLNLTAVPLPAAAWLLGSALLGLAGFNKAKRQTV